VKLATDVTERRQNTNDIACALEELAKGNLAHRIAPSNLDDLRAVGQSFNQAMEQLSNAIDTVITVSTTVSSKAGQIDGSVAELSQRTETQAATLEQTAAALDELTSSSRSAADGAKEVEKIVVDAISGAQGSNLVVQNAVEAMDHIQESSDKISNIVSMIDDIFFQINLLALNAGVEAARAGDAGRGFAVVASEVRALAKRSTEASSEIKQRISESSGHVVQGVGLVRKAGDELISIVSNVGEISDHLAEIVHSAQQQSITLDEINIGVRQLDAVTQQNAAMVDDTSGASRILVQDASDLAGQVSTFTIRHGEQSAAAPEEADDFNDLSAASSF